MIKFIVATLLFLFTIQTLADVKNREKAKFDLISSIEVLVNIDECRKGLHTTESSVMPRACNTLPYLSKYFFDAKKDRSAVEEYLSKEESKITETALKLVQTFKITTLGKMTLSTKCVKNRDPLDLDLYLNKIKGIPVPAEESKQEDVSESKPRMELRNPARAAEIDLSK
jgi:hypothetical protein